MTSSACLPNGWAVTTLGEAAKYQNGRAFKPIEWKAKGLPIIRIQNLNDSSAPFNFSDERHEEKFVVTNGDLLFAWSATLGAHIWRGEKAWLNQHIFRVDHATEIDRRFLYFALKNLVAELYTKAHGSGMVHVTKKRFEETPLWLPPLDEQRRIVDRIETLFDEIDRGAESLRAAKKAIGRYRQSLLKAAFEGRLTADWRAKNPDKLKCPEALLARVQEERASHYEAAVRKWEQEVAEWKEGGEVDRKPAKPKRPRTISAEPMDDGILGWTTVPLGLIVFDPIYGTSKKCGYGAGTTGVLRIPNIRSGRVDPADLKSADFDEAELARFSLEEGDVLTVRSNGSLSIVGKPALVQQQHTAYLFAGYLIRLKPIAQLLVPKYLLYFLMEPRGRAQIETKAKSTSGVNNISAKELQELKTPVCCPEEQAEIVRVLDERIEAAEVLDAEIEANRARADALRQSILKKAFAGQLVPQNPTDEPAAILLQRIRAESKREARIA